MKKILIFLCLIAVLVVGTYKFYPTQATQAQKMLVTAGRNLGTAMVLSIKALRGTDSSAPRPKVSDNGHSTLSAHRIVKSASSDSHTSQSETQNTPRVAPTSAICWITGPDGKQRQVTPAQWNEFVKQHPDYWVTVGQDQYTGTYIWIANAPNISRQQPITTSAPIYLVDDLGTDLAGEVTYSTFQQEVSQHSKDGWKVFHQGNVYVLVPPGNQFTFETNDTVVNPAK